MKSNRILFIVSIVLAVMLYFWTGSLLALVGALFLGGLMLFLALGVLATRWLTEIDISVPASCTVGGDAFIVLRLRRGLPVSAALITFDIASTSATFRLVERHVASIAMNTRHNAEIRIPLNADYYGRTEVTMDRCWCEDPLGLFRCSLALSMHQSCVVYPAAMTLATNVKHVPLSRAFGETYDESRSGSDVDEVFDVREFQAGDHLASVHWKLSSKFDVMMSRQFSHPVDFELIVASVAALSDASGSALESPLLNGVAAVSEAISSDFVQQGFSHNYALPVNGELVSVMVDGVEAMDEVSELLLDAPLPKRYAESVACLMSSEVSTRFTKCVLVTPVFDEHLWAQLSFELDLSVVLVTAGSGVQQIGGNYDLVVVDVEDTEGHERCISL